MILADLEWFPPRIMRTYPHLLAEDALVWSAYLQTAPILPQRVAYDVHVGTAAPTTFSGDTMLPLLSAALTRKRIDVVAAYAAQIHVIELKPYTTHSTIGQVMMYAELFQEEFHPPQPVAAAIICFGFDLDVPAFAARHQVLLLQVANPNP